MRWHVAGCNYSRSKTRISYYFRDVTTRYPTATYQAREAWNDSLSVPHFYGTGSTSADFNVYDAEYQSNDWWAWVVHDCSSTHVSKKYMHWNARTMAGLSSSMRAKIGMHEMGHIYGLRHDDDPCGGPTIMGPNVTNCAANITWRDYSAVNYIY